MSEASGSKHDFLRGEPRELDGVVLALAGLVARLAAAAWGATRFPPAEDGHFYHVVATRIARGLGYTWLWPDGAVTYAAHYPVGYPAMLGAAYALLGARPGWAMVLNAVLGALCVLSVHRVASAEASRSGAILAALGVAFHPGLVLYTPALMTEGVAAALLAVAAWLTVRARAAPASPWLRAAAVGGALGVATLVRPQSLILAPLTGLLCTRNGTKRRRALLSILVTATALAVCSPWTVRNCVRMNACVLVSANAGWNLFIGGAEGATGTWVPLEQLGVPVECREVWGEAEKDACFERAGVRAIGRSPLRWLALVPKKLAATFDYAGAAGWYLHSSNPTAFGDGAKLSLGAAETVWQRLIVLCALGALARGAGPRAGGRRGVAALSAAFLFTRAAWVAHVGIVLAAALLGRRLPDRATPGLGAASVLATAVIHAVFFGAGRYSVVCFPALAALAGTVLTAANPARDTEA
jgi:4-amino-4-deoxy-L-arabinose transferase-like glycosyltransferase